jgi:very-short-patch-repair endonuclease
MSGAEVADMGKKTEDKYYSYEGAQFRNLPERAQDLWFEWLLSQDSTDANNDALMFAGIYGFGVEGCESPIEKLFYFAFNIYSFSVGFNTDFERYLSLEPQHEIVRKSGKKYRADFYLCHEFQIPEQLGIVIECDGHEFHEKTKEQVAYNNERDMELKKMGYDVLHFSGRQIYLDPLKCAKEVYEYFKGIAKIDMEQGLGI